MSCENIVFPFKYKGVHVSRLIKLREKTSFVSWCMGTRPLPARESIKKLLSYHICRIIMSEAAFTLSSITRLERLQLMIQHFFFVFRLLAGAESLKISFFLLLRGKLEVPPSYIGEVRNVFLLQHSQKSIKVHYLSMKLSKRFLTRLVVC